MAQTNQGTAGPDASPRPPARQYVEDFYIYELDQLAIVASSTANSNIQVQADSDFKLVKLALMADVAAAGQTASTLVIPLVTMQLVDTGSGRQLFSNPVALGALFGSGQLPFILPVPRIFKARSNIALTFTNYDDAQTYNLRMAFIGAKIFTLGA